MADAGFRYSSIGRPSLPHPGAGGWRKSMSERHQFDPTVLREYDNPRHRRQDAVARRCARGRAWLRHRSGAAAASGWPSVGWGLSSPELASGMVDGPGVDRARRRADRHGSTPQLYFAARHLALDAGVQITGSHNPPDYNGFKMVLGKAPFWGRDIQELGRRVTAGDLEQWPGQGDRLGHPSGVCRAPRHGPQMGRAPAHGVLGQRQRAAGDFMVALVKNLPARHPAQREGRRHLSGPYPIDGAENLKQLQASVAANRADVGIAFDGDADRIGAIDAQVASCGATAGVALRHDVLASGRAPPSSPRQGKPGAVRRDRAHGRQAL
jgi:phosphomannomutase